MSAPPPRFTTSSLPPEFAMADRLLDLLTLLDSSDVRDRIHEMIADLGGVPDADAAALEAAMDERLRGIAESLRDVCIDDDSVEAYSLLPGIWLELRFEWMRYNMQMQYQTVLRGRAEPTLMARGAALSYLLEAVEMSLDSESAFVVTKIAADPAGTALGAITQTERMFQRLSAASAGGRNAVEALLQTQDQIARHTDSPLVREEFSKAISAVIENVGAGLLVSSADFTQALEGVLLRHLGTLPLRVVLQDASPDATLTIPSAVANGLLTAARGWMDAMRDSSLATDAVQRIASGRAGYVTITSSLSRLGDLVRFSLADDGDGCVLYRPDRQVWPIRDFKLSMTQQAGVGSTMLFGCNVTSISEYLMLRVGARDDDAMIGVPLRMVGHIEQRDASAIALHGACLVDRTHGGTVQLIDLGQSLFNAPIGTDDATYVHVHPDGEDQPAVALRVRAVTGICRGSVKWLPTSLPDSPLRGFVYSDRDLVGIIDFDRLLGHGSIDHARVLVAA